MTAHLFLLTPGSDRLGREHAEPWVDRDGWYVHAATLDIEAEDDVQDTLELVFDLTQHGRGDWTTRDEVQWVSNAEVRSSYVGDVIVLEGARGDTDSQAVYEIALAGFRRIDVPADQIPTPRVVPPTPAEWEAEQRALRESEAE